MCRENNSSPVVKSKQQNKAHFDHHGLVHVAYMHGMFIHGWNFTLVAEDSGQDEAVILIWSRPDAGGPQHWIKWQISNGFSWVPVPQSNFAMHHDF